MSRNINKILVLLAVAGLSTASCRKFLNVNENPNGAQQATLKTLLPAAQLYIGSSVGVDMEIIGSFWVQYWTQSPQATQYRILDQYAPPQDQFSTAWSNLYAANENFYQLRKLADSQKNDAYKAVAMLMEAYTFQCITDGWGDVPYRQALKGQYSDGHIVSPKYDSQMVVYNGILAMVDSAKMLINTTKAIGPSTDDLIYGGVMTQWIKFANTLKLKMYLRIAKISPSVAQAGIAALYAGAHPFIADGDDAKISYGYNSQNQNPLYSEQVGLSYTQNLAGSSTCIDSMNSNNDYRAYVFYEPASGTGPGTGAIAGIRQGDETSYQLTQYSIPSVYVAGNAKNSASANAPVNLLTSYESYFLQAEASARGYGDAGNDSNLFYHGIQSSFNYYSSDLSAATGTAGSDALYIYLHGDTANAISRGYWEGYPGGGTTEEKVRFIITQKYFAMCGNQGFEAWTEWRRTGYPDFLVYSKASIAGNNFPERFLYPTTESTTNASFPGLAPLTSKVWWDVL